MLKFYTLSSKPGDPPMGTLDLVNGKLVATGSAELFLNRFKRQGLSDEQTYAELQPGWNNGHVFTVEG